MRETNRSEVRAQDAMAVSHIAARKRDEITPQGVEGDRTKAARPTHSCTYAGNLPYTVYTPSRRRMRPRRCAQEGKGGATRARGENTGGGRSGRPEKNKRTSPRKPPRARIEPVESAGRLRGAQRAREGLERYRTLKL
ncbi:unnamed protein product [Prorocentrum cordatum]|uniref:Uncharacterized protein n=1 Tax=Prorocentrum cordatum TaxID=2364126 RepID=A0ABN9WBV9_9DINO|nr:unnamed protein product [Polarella glacialis]